MGPYLSDRICHGIVCIPWDNGIYPMGLHLSHGISYGTIFIPLDIPWDHIYPIEYAMESYVSHGIMGYIPWDYMHSMGYPMGPYLSHGTPWDEPSKSGSLSWCPSDRPPRVGGWLLAVPPPPGTTTSCSTATAYCGEAATPSKDHVSTTERTDDATAVLLPNSTHPSSRLTSTYSPLLQAFIIAPRWLTPVPTPVADAALHYSTVGLVIPS